MNRIELYALSSIKGVGPKAIELIIEFSEARKLESLVGIDVPHLIHAARLTRYESQLKPALEVQQFEILLAKARERLSDFEAKNINVVSITDDEYPLLLKISEQAPTFLYCKGNMDLLRSANNVAVVGTRKNTTLGQRITEKTVDFLCQNGYTIVSGLALGIDTIAHAQSIACGGKTIAVLVDVDNVQPRKNVSLATGILANDGLLVAENPPGTPIIPSLFAKRDRIQSGLSIAVFPIETSVDGGTMHAVKSGIRNRRLVYAPDNQKSGYPDRTIPQIAGTQDLIDKGHAIPYTKSLYPEILANLAQRLSELTSNAEAKNISLSVKRSQGKIF